jgi:hypothetical protein
MALTSYHSAVGLKQEPSVNENFSPLRVMEIEPSERPSGMCEQY